MSELCFKSLGLIAFGTDGYDYSIHDGIFKHKGKFCQTHCIFVIVESLYILLGFKFILGS